MGSGGYGVKEVIGRDETFQFKHFIEFSFLLCDRIIILKVT